MNNGITEYLSVSIILALCSNGLVLTADDRSQEDKQVFKSITGELAGIPEENEDDIILRYFDPETDSAILWVTEVGGYVHGYNGYFDTAKGTGFIPGPGYYLREIRIWWGIKSEDVTDETYLLEILEGFSTGPGDGPNKGVPPIYSEEFLLSEINADSDPETNLGPTIYTFEPPIEIPEVFFVSLYFGDYTTDNWLAGVYATDLRGAYVSVDWEIWENLWWNMSESWFGGEDGWNMWIEAVITDDPVSAPEEELPGLLTLGQNYPNPFNPATVIDFALPNDSHVILTIYDLLGREVARLIDKEVRAGTHSVTFDASNLTSGVYFYRIQAGDLVKMNRMTLLK